MDPLTIEYPWYTPYQFAGNKPIAAIDIDGLEDQIAIDGSTITGPVDLQKINREIVRKTLNQYITAMSTKPISSAKNSLNQTFIGPNNSPLNFQQTQSRIRKMEIAQNYQNLRNSVSRESRLIGQGIGIGLNMAPVGLGLRAGGLAARGLSAKTLLNAGKRFGTGFGINASTQLAFNSFEIDKVDFADATSSGISALITKKFGANLIFDAGVSSTIDLTIADGLNTVFDGGKSNRDALIDFGVGISTGLLGNLTDKVIDSNKSRAFLKNLNPSLRKVITEVIKASESGTAGAAGEKLKEN